MQGDLFQPPEPALTPSGSATSGDTPALEPAGASDGEEERGVGAGGRLLTAGLKPSDAADVALCLAVGAENEVRGVLRQLLNEGLQLDAVEIAYTDGDPYLPLLLDAFFFLRRAKNWLCSMGRRSMGGSESTVDVGGRHQNTN